MPRKNSTSRSGGCYELYLDALNFYLCQLASQQDLTQNNHLETHSLSSLCCRLDSEEVLIWTWSSWSADQNMLVGRSAGSSTKAPLQTPY